MPVMLFYHPRVAVAELRRNHRQRTDQHERGNDPKERGSSELGTRNSKLIFGVWCNASIRVLGTRGDSSILSSPTIPIFGCGFRNAD